MSEPFVVAPLENGLLLIYNSATQLTTELLLDRRHLPSSDWLRSRIADLTARFSHCVGERNFTLGPESLTIGIEGMNLTIPLRPEWRNQLLEEIASWRMTIISRA